MCSGDPIKVDLYIPLPQEVPQLVENKQVTNTVTGNNEDHYGENEGLWILEGQEAGKEKVEGDSGLGFKLYNETWQFLGHHLG